MNRQLKSWFVRACLAAGASSLLPVFVAAQSGCPQPNSPPPEPPGRDMFVPYVGTPGLAHERELQNVEQVKLLAEINKLTVELVKRRSNRNLLNADTPRLVRRLKDLAKRLRDGE